MYSFEGTPLENPTLGWKLIKGTTFFAPLAWSGDSVTVPGRDEQIPAPSSLGAPVFPVVIYTRKSGLEALLAMWSLKNGYIVDDVSGRRVRVTVLAVLPSGGGAKDIHVKVTAMLQIDGVFWRDTVETTSAPSAVAAASVVVPVMAGLSAPVRDALIRVKGQANGLQVSDSVGSFFRYTLNLVAGSYLRFESATGKAFVTTTDVWTGGSEVTGSIVNGPGPYPLQLTPKFTNPAERWVELTIATTSRAGASVEVRGRRAYVPV